MKAKTNTITLKKFATLVTTATIVAACASCHAIPVSAAKPGPPTIANSINGSYYPLTGIVTDVTPDRADNRTEVITFSCSNGNLFSFTAPATDCWDIDDLVSCIMDNKGTGIVTDDEVVTTMYAGSLDQFYDTTK